MGPKYNKLQVHYFINFVIFKMIYNKVSAEAVNLQKWKALTVAEDNLLQH